MFVVVRAVFASADGELRSLADAVQPHGVGPARAAGLRIPELDTILPYSCRKTKKPSNNDPNVEFMKHVPEQYHGAILAKMADERAVTTGRHRAAGSAASAAVKK